jgi:peptide deformylase
MQRLIDEMIETMHDAYGVGLAAPQVGKLWQIIVIELPGEEAKTLINPEVVKKVGERMVEEGCLSIPGYRGEIKRSVLVTVKGYNRQGKEIRLRGKELLAQALEHEIDHLNGILYIDYLESPDKLYKIDWEQAGL